MTKIIHNYNLPVTQGQGFSNCCGSVFVKSKTYLKRNTKGIALAVGTIGEECNTPTYTLSHITTKNGPITVCVRKKW